MTFYLFSYPSNKRIGCRQEVSYRGPTRRQRQTWKVIVRYFIQSKHHAGLAIAVLFLCLGMAFLPSPASAQTGEYETIARNFLLFRGSDKQIISTGLLRSNDLAPDQPTVDIAFLAALSDGGYILVSTSRSISPVKAYSLTGDFDTLPPAYRRYLLYEAEARVRNPPAPAKYPLGLSETEQSWDFLLQFDPARRTPFDYTPDTVLLTTRWNQNAPYNKFLPEIEGENALTGCVNVAMAQLMKYHGYPATGQGVATHTWNDNVLEAVFARPYNWGNMPDVVGLAESEYKVDEAALLIRDLAIMNRTSFGSGESSASANLQALAEHFGYSKDIMSMDNQNVNLFFDKLCVEIDKLQPVLLEFTDINNPHMVVADGYRTDSDPTGRNIHLNMGWGGHNDDYYYLNETIEIDTDDDEITDITFDPFNPKINIHYNIKPCTDGSGDCAVNLETADNLEGTTITGSFDYAGDADRYAVYLNVATTITGSREYYSGQAFFISVYDSNNTRIIPLVSEPSVPWTVEFTNLAPDLYTVRVSLTNDVTGASYPYDEHTGYTATIVTTALTAEEKAAVDGSLDSPPFIGNTLKDRLFNSSVAAPSWILIDARDVDGDPVSLNVLSTNPGAITAAMAGNILVLAPVPGASHTASRIVITATANGKQAEKSFIAMVDNRDIAFGKSFTVSGIFESQEDSNAHLAILDENCTITGYNGYSNQAFYSSAVDSANEVIAAPRAGPISGTFSRNTYTLKASLEENPGGYGGYYVYDQGVNDQYQLTVSCPNADEATATIAGLLGIDLGKIVPVALGDLDDSKLVDLADAIICLRALSRRDVAGLRTDFASSGVDVAGDGRVGLQDAVYILQKTAGMR